MRIRGKGARGRTIKTSSFFPSLLLLGLLILTPLLLLPFMPPRWRIPVYTHHVMGFLNDLGHHLPGLKHAEPTLWIVIGLLAIVAAIVAIVADRPRNRASPIAVAATVVWCGACVLTFLDNAWSISFIGSSTPRRDNLMWRVLPAYLVVGTCLPWLAYAIVRKASRERGARLGEGRGEWRWRAREEEARGENLRT